jgi:hypothetical protein
MALGKESLPQGTQVGVSQGEQRNLYFGDRTWR